LYEQANKTEVAMTSGLKGEAPGATVRSGVVAKRDRESRGHNRSDGRRRWSPFPQGRCQPKGEEEKRAEGQAEASRECGTFPGGRVFAKV
jgi:hypothetical protein